MKSILKQGVKYRITTKNVPSDNHFFLTPLGDDGTIDYSWSITAYDVSLALATGNYEEIKQKVKRVYKCYEFKKDYQISDIWTYNKGDLVWNFGSDNDYDRSVYTGLYIRRPELDKTIEVEV